ncbi:hypothetical protein GN277_28470 (plasmid) [Lachnospiraceae bacterium WCA-9-b2]|uniref:Uncharacterized protein n=1 Tax=Sporofaciens musculi TaxID=2681861 RepID=A0A7X3MMC1_9FIRM|nr:hypothetical protein [Sporofaciens musculi]MXP79096.1 hypothetical protein [Sporofaciens musculi]
MKLRIFLISTKEKGFINPFNIYNRLLRSNVELNIIVHRSDAFNQLSGSFCNLFGGQEFMGITKHTTIKQDIYKKQNCPYPDGSCYWLYVVCRCVFDTVPV